MRNSIKSLSLNQDKSDFLAVVSASKGPNKKNLMTLRDTVLGAYDTYITELSNVNIKAITMSQAVHKSFYSLYDGTGPTVKKLKEDIKSDAEAICLLCALNEYDSLDHYLPRAIFPEFSISSRNLVPICTVCNRDWKKQMWGGGSNRPFFHPHVDYLAVDDYLLCDVNVVNSALSIKFSIDITKASDPILGKILTNHFSNLNLAIRFRKRTQKDDVDDLIRSMQGKVGAVEREVALMSYIEPLLKNKRDHRLLAFYRGVSKVAKQIAATKWPEV